MSVVSLDHLVLTVSSLEATIDFYTRALGMKLETFGEGRSALHFGDQKVNLHGPDDHKRVDRTCIFQQPDSTSTYLPKRQTNHEQR